MSKKKNRPVPSSPVSPPSPPSLFAQILWVGGSFWLLFLCVKFYQFQPFPFTTLLNILLPADLAILPTWPVLLDDIVGLTWGLAFLCSAIFVGRVILSRFIREEASALESVVLAAGLGYGVLSYLTFALGAAGLFQKIIFKVLIVSLTVGFFAWFFQPSERQIFGNVWKEGKDLLFSSGKRFYLSMILIFILGTDFVMIFVPELYYDALVYHLGVPNYYLQEGRLVSLPVMNAKFPFTIQFLHLIGLALKDEMVSKFTHFSMLILISGAMLALGLRFKKPLWGLVSALFFAAIPTVQLNVTASGVDVGGSLFAFLGIYSLLVFLELEENHPWLVLSGIFSGLALGSKYTAAPAVVSLGLVLLVACFRKKLPISRIISYAVIYGGCALLLIIPWFLKNWIDVGNPLYPFFSKIFGGQTMEPWRYDILKGENNGLPLHSIRDFFMAVWRLSIAERSSLSFQGPLFLGVIPFAFYGLTKQTTSVSKNLFIGMLLFLSFAMFMTRLTRYWMPGMTFVALFLSLGVAELLEDKSNLKKMLVLGVVSTAIFFQITWVYLVVQGSYKPLDVLLGRVSRKEFISHYHSGMNPNPSIPMYQYMETNFKLGEKVLLVGEEKAYPIKVKHLYSGVYDQGPLVALAEVSRTPGELAQKLTELGLTHLMFNTYEANRLAGYGIFSFSPQAFGVFCAFWENNLSLQKVEEAPLGQGYTNPLLLLKILPEGRIPGASPLQNVLVQFYEKYDFPRMGLTSVDQQINFYREQTKVWPKVSIFQRRLQELEKK